jgi:tetratricopeptide (TPR) repeat protein
MLTETQSRRKFDRALSLLELKKIGEAEAVCRKVIYVDADNVNFLALLGTISILKREPAQAIDFLKQAVAIEPDFAKAQTDLGNAYLFTNDYENAVVHLRRSIEIEPENETAFYGLADALLHTGRGKEADEVLEKAFLLNPDKGKLAKAGEYIQQNKHKAAEKLTREVLRRNPENVDAMRMLAKLAMQANIFKEAEKLLRRVIELVPALHGTYLDLAQCLREQDKYDEAVEYAKKAIRLRPDKAQSYSVLASLLAAGSRTHEAIEAYKACLEFRKDSSNIYLGYGHVLKTAGKQNEGIKAYKDAIRVKAHNGEAYWSLANLKTYPFSDDEIIEMESILDDKDLDDENRVHFLFSLAKAYEDQKNYEKAFHYYNEGNTTQRMHISYDPVQTEVLHEDIKKVFTREFLSSKKNLGNPDPSPIFIVGLPRSGSTLIEQILSSHSQVDGTSELPDLSKVVMSLNKQRRAKGYPSAVAELEDEEFYQLGSKYIESTKRVRRGAPYFTDKMPNNFPTIGFLSLFLPNARVINAMRHPLDSCMGCYKQHFARGQTFTYDLMELGEFYLEYHSIMQYWHSVLPGKILDVQYELMVTDQEAQTRRLLEYCGLPWEDACLNFHETDRPVRTASSEQVRQPIYESSLNTWCRYESHLQDLIEILKPVL